MNNENVSNNIIVNNDTSLDKCNRDIMGNREDDATLLDDDENDNRSLESQMSTTSNHQSSLDSVERHQSKDNTHHDQHQDTSDSDDDAGSVSNRNQSSTLDTSNHQSLTVDPPTEGLSKDPDFVAFYRALLHNKRRSWHLEKAFSILIKLGSAVIGDQYDDIFDHLKQVRDNSDVLWSHVDSYFGTTLPLETIQDVQVCASEDLNEYISSLKDEEESDSSEPPSFEEDDESMLSSGSKGESDQDEPFPCSSSKKRGRGDKDGDDEEVEDDPPPRPRKQRSRSSEAASDDESQDESQMYEKDQDDDETEQSQSKANKQQEKEAKDKEKAEQQEKVEDAKYDALPEAWEQANNESSSSNNESSKAIVAVETNVNDKVADYIDRSIDPNNPNRLDNRWSLLNAYMIIIRPSIRANSMLLSRSKTQADGLASVVGLGENAPMGSLLLYCDPDNNEIREEDPEITVEWGRLTAAIDLCDTKLSTKEFLTLGTETRNMIMHLLHSQTLHFVLSELTLVGVTAHLSAKASVALTSAMKELAQLVDPDAHFSSSMVVLSFMKQFALPGLVMNGARGKAVDVIIDIFGSLTCPSGRMSKEQTKAYKTNILSLFERVDASTISGGRVEGNVSNYFCGKREDRVFKDRRKRVISLGLTLYLKYAIMELLNMSGNGYVRGILRLSASDVMRKVSPLITKAFFKEGESSIKAVEKMKKLVMKKKPKSRTLLIESDEQVECLQHLINLLRTSDNDSDD